MTIAAVVLAGVLQVSAAPARTPLALAAAVMAAANAGDASGFAGLFTNDAIVVDENPPFRWNGAGAGIAWWRVIEGVERKGRMRQLRAIDVRNGEFAHSAADAYLAQTMTVTGIAGTKRFSEPGTMTYTFRKTGAGWLISSMVWTAKS